MSDAVFAGVMSGTSLDGIDAVVARFPESDAIRPFEIIGSTFLPFPNDLKAELFALQNSGNDEIARASRAAWALAELYAQTVCTAADIAGIKVSAIKAAGIHGQTVRHCPQQSWTCQVNNPARVAELLGIDVVADFRSRDLAAGGQGAPLTPMFHKSLLGDAPDSAVLNIGGMANVTILDSAGKVIGFDTGPGNVLLDTWYAQHHDGAFDRDGAWAATGNVMSELLQQMLDDPFFAQKPPKSTGRDHFNGHWLQQQSARFSYQNAQDVQATLLMLTATSITQALKPFNANHVYVCGGGAHNQALMTRLAELLAPCSVESTQMIGVAPEHVEALAFAWLAREALARRALDLTSVTGACHASILGAIYPGG
jgi:Predicted molecular chaperone distantly related to HSP70-fold metalloproteases